VSHSPSRFIAVCPNCLVRLKVNYAFSGHMVRCKFCEHKFEALAPDSPQDPGLGRVEADLSEIDSLLSENDRMSVVCPSCSTYLRVRSIHAGHHVRCGKCQKKFLIPKIVPSRRPKKSAVVAAKLAEQLQGKLDGLQNGQGPGGDARAGSKGGPDSVRGVLSRFLDEFRALEAECARLRSERRTIGSRYKRLRGKYEFRKLELQKARSEHQGAGPRLAAIREALGNLSAEDVARLKAEHDRLCQDRDRFDAELARLREAREALQSERDGIRDELARLQAEHDQLRFEQDLALQEHHQQGAELAGLKVALGELSPDDIGLMGVERDALRTEASRLREQIEDLQGELSGNGELAEILAQRDAEVRSSRSLGERLKGRIEQLETALDDSRAERDRLIQEVERAVGELEIVRARSAEIAEQVRERDEASRSTRARLEELAAQLGSRDEELAAARAEIERQAGQWRAAADEAERLRADLAALERDARQRILQRDEASRSAHEELQGHAEWLRSRDDDLAAAQAELERLAAQLRSHDEEFATSRAEIERQAGELQAAIDEAGQLRSRDQELVASRARLEELDAQLRSRDQELDAGRAELERLANEQAAARADVQRLAEELGSRDEELAASRAESERQAGRLQAAIDEAGQLRSRDQELDASRAELDRLAELLRSRDGELDASRAEIERHAAGLRAATDEAERLRADLAALEQDTRASRRDQDVRIESFQRDLDQAKQKHRDERTQLAEQLRSKYQELDAAESRRKSLEARVVELQDTVRKLKSEKSSFIMPEVAQPATPFSPGSGARRSLNEDAMVEALMEIRLGGRESVRPAGRQEDGLIPLVQPQASQEAEIEQARRNEEAQKEIETLRKKLAEKEAYVKKVASMLAGMGINPSRM
jgi:chromosome segregation ATPase